MANLEIFKPHYGDDKIILPACTISDNTLALIYGAIKKYAADPECYDDVKSYIYTLLNETLNPESYEDAKAYAKTLLYEKDSDSQEEQNDLPDARFTSSYIDSTGLLNSIEENKETIVVTDENFWKLIDSLEWRFHITRGNEEKEVIKELSQKVSDSYNREDLSNKLSFYSKALYDHLNRYAKANYPLWSDFCKSCGFLHSLSDDSTWYLCTFIVGCGKKEYDKVMLDPTRISEFKDYTEGFQYIF